MANSTKAKGTKKGKEKAADKATGKEGRKTTGKEETPDQEGAVAVADRPQKFPDTAVTAPGSDSEEWTDEEIRQAENMGPVPKERTVHDLPKSTQHWTTADPNIPEHQRSTTWVSVFKCEAGHKTKATNEYKQVDCHACGKPATIMPQFLSRPPEMYEQDARRGRRLAADTQEG